MGNAVVHFEIGAADDQPLIAFYQELFGWGLQPFAGGGYTMIDTRAGAGINGGIGKSQTGEPWSAFYVEADDLQAMLDKANSLGGTTVMPVTDFGGAVTIAMFNDPDGLLVGLVQAAAGSGPDDAPAPSAGAGEPVDWFEVLGSDAEQTQKFYAELFGWTVDDSGFPGYAMVRTGSSRGIQGGLGGGDDTRWATIYASVADVEQSLARAEELGGSRIYGPRPVDDHMETGAFRDPAGNVFGVYHHGAH
ncbi:MAG TPA: VOC family protein [Streptosporangiaceae bacterium]|nr:VOC family protein [Streptosporangiaceae bacterium]